MSLSPARLRLAWLIFIGWIVITSLLLFYLGNRHYGTFASGTNWVPEIVQVQALGITPASGFQLVHVFADGCACNARAEAHIRQIDKQQLVSKAEQYFFSPQQLDVAGLPLPATPAVLIFLQGTLLYAGPYASGPLCSVDDSLVLPVLKEKAILPGLWLNAETSACRCPVN